LRQLVIVIYAAALASCDVGPSRHVPFSDALASVESLGVGVLDALAARDRGALRRIALDEAEFREHVWPDLPAARPERNLPFSFVWGDLHQKSEHSLTETLARHGGKHLTLVAVRFAGAATNYPSYTVHREAILRVRDPSGVESELRAFGSAIEKDGRWKVFSYVVD
jgi:hypothetical protein